MAYVNDLFGIELNTATGPAFKAAGLEVVDTKSYPLGAKDLSPILKGFKDAGADAFVGLTYPPDNILATTQAKEVDWNPAVFFTGVGTAFPFYRDRFKGAEGVMGIAGWNPKVKFPGAKEYFDAHVKKHQKEPDRWASAFAYASLQILERCVGEVGLDRPKIKAMLDTTEFQTVAGPIKFAKGENVATPGVGGAVAEERVRARVAQGLGHRARGGAEAGLGVTLSPTLLLDVVVGGFTTGGIYALVALGLNLQYGLMRVLNVAHGEFLMLGAYVTFSLHTGWGVNPLLTLLITGPTAFAVGLVLHRLLYAPLLAGDAAESLESRSLLLSFGLMFVLQNAALLIWSADLRGYSYLAIPAAVARHRLPRQPRARGRDRARPGRGLLPLSPLQPDRQGGARPDAGAGGRAAHGHPDLAHSRPLLRRGHRDVGGDRLARQHAVRADPVHGPALHRDRAGGRHPGRARQHAGLPHGRAAAGPGRDRRRLPRLPDIRLISSYAVLSLILVLKPSGLFGR